uniref:P-loop containing nucleoside triphosphate hydrolase protein n=1 Tax=Rhabditophanes sp. KR3021 TaxID=114890 RepID=A0AC35TMW8_9BILA
MVGSIRLGQNITQISAIVSAKLAGGEIFDVIEREPEIDCCSSVGEQPRHFQGNIAFSNVTFRYPSRPTQQILNEISFEVKANTQVALVGSSGSGKSTVMTLLMKYYNVESGSITLDGKPIQDLNIKWLRQMIAIVPQGSVLFTASIRDNIKIGKIDATDEEVIEACKTAHAHDFIMKLPYQYDTMVGEGGISLSGGQAQRVQIAKAVIRSSRILLLDEATSALDSESESIVQKALDAASKGRTTIAIAHRLSTIRNYDNIVVFKEGDIIEIGNHDELMKNKGYYHSLILAQQTQERNVDNGCDEKSLASTKTEYNERSIDGAIEESEEDDAQISRERLSKRLGRSMVSVKSIDDEEDENVRDSMHDIGASEATIMDIIKFGKRDFKIAAFGLIFVIGRGLTWPVFSIIYGNLFKTLSNPDNSEDANKLSIIFICSAFAVLGICSMIFTIAAGTMFGISGERMTKRLRVAVYKNILSQDASYFDSGKHSVSTLSNRLASDAPNVQAAIDMRLAEVLQGVVSLIAGLIISFVYGWRMAFVGIGTALTLLVVNVSTSNLLKRRAMEDSHTAERASQIALESIENVKTIQDMTFHDDVMHMFHKASEEPMRRAIIRGYLQAFSYSFSLAFVSFNFAVSYSIGTILIVNNYVTPYVVFQVIEALNMASMSLMNAASYFPEYVRARCSAGLLFKMISEKSSIDNFGKGGNTKKIHGNIQIESAHFAYPHMPRQKVLKNLSINVDFGQTLALCGPSGSGKSTTIQLLERYYDLSVGEVLIDNINIKHYNVNHLRKAISIVSQQPILFNLTVKQNICYGSCGMSDDEVVEAARNANIADFIETLPQKYNTYIGPRGRNLSLGQAQRLSIARAIIRQPRILLLDEPSASLDAASEKVVQEALDKASRGRTCVVIAHRLKTIEKADCIGVIADGRVQEMGEHHQLLDHKGIYYNLAKQQTL